MDKMNLTNFLVEIWHFQQKKKQLLVKLLTQTASARFPAYPTIAVRSNDTLLYVNCLASTRFMIVYGSKKHFNVSTNLAYCDGHVGVPTFAERNR